VRYGHYLDDHHWFIAGVIAKFVMPGDTSRRIILTTILESLAHLLHLPRSGVRWYHAERALLHRRIVGAVNPSLPLRPYHGPAQRLAAQVWTGCHTADLRHDGAIHAMVVK